MRRHLLSLATGSAALLAGCADNPTPTAPITRPELTASASVTSVTEPTTGLWARVVEGETGPGSLYAIFVPRSWNGDVVYYAHGIRPPLDPITLGGVTQTGTPEERGQDKFFDLRDALGAKGYAFVYSSFSENGFAVKDAAQRTHQLRGLVEAQLPTRPTRNFLAGYSMGALVAINLAERFPGQYNGVLAACGMIGGSALELQYIGDVRALFDAIYGASILPGGPATAPEVPLSLAELQGRVIAAVSANPMGLFVIASTAQTPLAYAPIGTITDPRSIAFQSLMRSLIVALYYHQIGISDVLDRTHGHSPYDNTGRTFTLGTSVLPIPAAVMAGLIAQADAGVARFEMTPDARNYLEQHYTPTGRLQVPVVTIHNRWDYLVPAFHEDAFAAAVNAAGASDMLWQWRAADGKIGVPNYGHCDNIPVALLMGAFDRLAG